jgi:hypothetical protein
MPLGYSEISSQKNNTAFRRSTRLAWMAHLSACDPICNLSSPKLGRMRDSRHHLSVTKITLMLQRSSLNVPGVTGRVIAARIPEADTGPTSSSSKGRRPWHETLWSHPATGRVYIMQLGSWKAGL